MRGRGREKVWFGMKIKCPYCGRGMTILREVSAPRLGQTTLVCSNVDYHAGQEVYLVSFSNPNVILAFLGKTSTPVALSRGRPTKSRKSPQAQDMRSADYQARQLKRLRKTGHGPRELIDAKIPS